MSTTFNLEKKTDKGVLTYRMPLISEAYRFLSKIGIFTPGIDAALVKADAIENLHLFVDCKSIDGCSSFEDLNKDIKNMSTPLNEIADEILELSLSVFKKNNT